jgi:hypothetical protein
MRATLAAPNHVRNCFWILVALTQQQVRQQARLRQPGYGTVRWPNSDDTLVGHSASESDGLHEREVQTALRALANARPPLLEYPRPLEELTYPIIITDVTERARRLVSQWPTADSLAAEITKALSEAADREPDPAKKSRLHEAATVLGETARGVVVEVLSRVVERHTGEG